VETLPLAESTGAKASIHAKIWYAKLAGVTSGGTVTVKANTDRGTVLIDDDVKGNLASGTLTIPGISEGRHTLAIEAKDYQRYETAVTVRTGETLSHSATLVEMSKVVPPGKEPISGGGAVATKSKSNVWKPIFYASAALEAGAIAFSIYEWRQGKSNADSITRADDSDVFLTAVGHANSKNELFVDRKDCNGSKVKMFKADSASQGNKALDFFDKACSNYKLQVVGWAGISVFGVAMVGSFVMAYIRDSDSSDSKPAVASSGHRKRRELAVTPIVSPDGGGATLRFDW
jgi:hypothetical protein